MYLDEVSDVVQAAFGWAGYHLHRFGIGDPFDPDREAYLCPFEVDEGEPGVDAREVRLDELLGEPGETCLYAYDYGDGWEVELRLADVGPGHPDQPRVRCTRGEGAAPPEDCGGPGGYDDLVAEGVDLDGRPFDPDAFDVDETSRTIRREVHTIPVIEVRTGAMALKLLSRHKGRLLLTRLGAQARRDPEVLREQLARLVD